MTGSDEGRRAGKAASVRLRVAIDYRAVRHNAGQHRWITILLTLALLGALVACGSGSDSLSSQATTQTTSAPTTTQSTPTPTTVQPTTSPDLSLAGEWLSTTNGSRYDFAETGADSYSGYVVDGGCASAPRDISDTVQGQGSYSGTENTFGSANPCVVAGSATNTIKISSDRNTAAWDSAGCSDCGPQNWVRTTIECSAAGNNSHPDYCVPAQWNTADASGLTPGAEPLNVIISAQSTVPLYQILKGMIGWAEVSAGTLPSGCLSSEEADVSGTGDVGQLESWRLEGCTGAINNLALNGGENHARLWSQPTTGSPNGAWFISASYETLCVERNGIMVPVKNNKAYFLTHPTLAWHCIDGSQGSIGSDGYDRGAKDFVAGIEAAASTNNWRVTVRVDPRPSGIGEGHAGTGVPFSGTVYVVTVDTATTAP